MSVDALGCGSRRGYNIPGRNCDFRLMILPDTMKIPSPV
jgi:hypothetical protein